MSFSLQISSQIIYVAAGATGDGSSWATAAGDLQQVLNSVLPGTQVWVKEGNYTPASCTNCSFNDRNQYFQIPNGVKIFGGFAGNETSINQRDIAAHPTHLNGDIDGDGTLANNSFSVVYTKNVSNLTQVDGFIIIGGNADAGGAGPGTPQSSGGGWFNVGSTGTGSSHPVIKNCTFTNNFAAWYGGGMFNDGSFAGVCNPSFSDCIFENNKADNGGGAMYNTGSFSGLCSPIITACSFENNECGANDGGAVFNIGAEGGVANAEFTDCIFRNNIAAHDGGAMYNFGKNGNSSPIVEDCLFDNNEGFGGGAVYNDATFSGFNGGTFSNCIFKNNFARESDGGAVYNSGFMGTSNSQFVDCTFQDNTSTFAGGAMFNNGVEGVCNPTITNCRFINNEAITFGGAMYNQGKTGNASPIITNCVFYKNKALSAGAIYNLGAEQGNGNAVITNCTFYENSAHVGGAVYANAGEDNSGIASPTVTNCIFWGNTASDIGDIFRIINGTPTISFSVVDKLDCTDLYNGNGGSLNCTGGMVFNQDPMFMDPLNGNFHLMANSPAIDDGDNGAVTGAGVDMDLDHHPRIVNGTVDFGVFEFGSTGTAPTIAQQPSSQEVCESETAMFSVSASSSQPLVYQWFKDGQPISGEEESTLTINNAVQADAGTYTCRISNDLGEEVTTSAADLVVNVPATVGLTIVASQENICEGEEVTLTANPVNGGSAPSFQWFINGFAFGGNVQSFSIDVLNDGDVFSCVVTSSETCVTSSTASSNNLTINVESQLEAALSIAPATAVLCENQATTFTAAPTNGGSSPSYQWSVNGTPAGGNSPEFIFTPQQNDAVKCVMTSSKTCLVMNPVSSEIFNVSLVPNEQVAVEIMASTDSIFCMGNEVTFTAQTEHGGNSPVYQWQVNGADVGANGPSFTTASLNQNDEVTCILTSSLACTEANPVQSNIINIDCVVPTNEGLGNRPMASILPNPAHGSIFVEISGLSGNFAARLLNTGGQILWSAEEYNPHGTLVRQAIEVSNFPQGVYYYQIISDTALLTKKVIVQ